MALSFGNLFNTPVDFSTPHDPNAAWYPEAQLSSGGFGFRLRNQQAKQFIDDLNARVSSGQINQSQANQAWANVHEAGNEEDRARQTDARRFQQGGVASVASLGIGGLAGGGFGAGNAAARIATAPGMTGSNGPGSMPYPYSNPNMNYGVSGFDTGGMDDLHGLLSTLMQGPQGGMGGQQSYIGGKGLI